MAELKSWKEQLAILKPLFPGESDDSKPPESDVLYGTIKNKQKGSTMKKRYRTRRSPLTKEQRKEMISHYRDVSKSYRITAEKFGVSENTVWYWNKKLRQDVGRPKQNGAGKKAWTTRRDSQQDKHFRYCPWCGGSLK